MRALPLLLLAAAACGGDDPAELEIEVGTGAPGRFVAVDDGASLLLQRGCQSAQHIFTSVRAAGASGDRALVRVAVFRLPDDAQVSSPLEVELPLVPAEDGRREITGLTPVIARPADVLDQDVVVRVRLEDQDGRIADGQMTGRVTWGPDACSPH